MGEDRTPSGQKVRGPATQRHFVRELDDSNGAKPLIAYSSGGVIVPVSSIVELRALLRMANRHGLSATFNEVNRDAIYSDGDVSVRVEPE